LPRIAIQNCTDPCYPFNQEKQISLFPKCFTQKAGRRAHLSFRGRRSAAPPTKGTQKPWPPKLRPTPTAKTPGTPPVQKTEEGKARSSRNNIKFGLFSINTCVQPEEQEDYDNFCSRLWPALAPADPIEEVAATEFIRNAWRLRRCGTAEETLGKIVASYQVAEGELAPGARGRGCNSHLCLRRRQEAPAGSGSGDSGSAGTTIDVTLRSFIGVPATVHGLHARPGQDSDMVTVAAGGLAHVRFAAGAPGTYLYWARTPDGRRGNNRGLDALLGAALVVDPPGSPAND
jgi:hypothetical protein